MVSLSVKIGLGVVFLYAYKSLAKCDVVERDVDTTSILFLRHLEYTFSSTMFRTVAFICIFLL